MRCESSNDPAQCQRCVHADVRCVFDRTNRRAPSSPAIASRDELHALNRELAAVKAQLVSQQQARSPDAQHWARITTPVVDKIAQPPVYDVSTPSSQLHHHNLSTEDLGAPVSAVHIMMYHPREGEPERGSIAWTAENQSRWSREEYLLSKTPDIITRGKIPESEARRLFDVYMQGANPILPIFDSILDTFDSIRAHSPSVFSAILYVAARHECTTENSQTFVTQCEKEARRCAAQSLFENPTRLESVEAMTILAVHSDKCWFALGHALQMALDLGLDVKFSSLVSAQHSNATRFSLRCARIWLLLTQYETSFAFGTKRRSRWKGITRNDLDQYLELPQSHPCDVSSCATIDLYQFLTTIRLSQILISTAEFEVFVTRWFAKWDACFEERGLHQHLFQRPYLKVQIHYAKIIYNAMKLTRAGSSVPPPDLSGQAPTESPVDIEKQLLESIKHFLCLIESSDVFLRTFTWAPTYDGSLLTFVIILGFQILEKCSDVEGTQSMLDQIDRLPASLLEKHPCSRFYKVV